MLSLLSSKKRVWDEWVIEKISIYIFWWKIFSSTYICLILKINRIFWMRYKFFNEKIYSRTSLRLKSIRLSANLILEGNWRSRTQYISLSITKNTFSDILDSKKQSKCQEIWKLPKYFLVYFTIAKRFWIDTLLSIYGSSI